MKHNLGTGSGLYKCAYSGLFLTLVSVHDDQRRVQGGRVVHRLDPDGLADDLHRRVRHIRHTVSFS